MTRRSVEPIGAVVVLVALVCGGVVAAQSATAASPPLVTKVSPSAGKTAGGTRVAVTGTSFRHVIAVTFGTSPGASIHVVSSTRLWITAPAHTAGTVNVRVSTTAGTSALRTADHYTYVSPPAVTGLVPQSGTRAGGTRVRVTGSNFSHVTAVNFGTVAGTSIHVVAPTRLWVTSPTHAVGLVGVRVTTAYGT